MVGVQVPYYRGRGAIDDTVRWAYWVGVAVIANRGYSEVGVGREDVGEIPAEGDGVALSDFEVGGGGLRRLCDGETTCGRRLRNAERARRYY